MSDTSSWRPSPPPPPPPPPTSSTPVPPPPGPVHQATQPQHLPARPFPPTSVPPPAPADGPPAHVAVQQLSKWFAGVVAVSEVTFAVGPGVTAVLGPNGAGKSTLLRLLSGLTPPSQGSVTIHGRNPRTDAGVRSRIGLVPQQETMFDGHTPLAFVELAATLHGVPDARDAARGALGVVELDSTDRRHISAYSKGMRQRVKVAAALVHDPDVLILDEPLTGLDPRQRRSLIELFHRLGETDRCVLVSSHVLDEVERFGSRVLVLAKGRLAATGDFRAIRDLMDNRPHRLRIGTDQPGVLAGALLGAGTVMGVQLTGPDSVIVETVDVTAFRGLVARVAAHHRVHLREVTPLDDDLDSVFRYLVGG